MFMVTQDPVLVRTFVRHSDVTFEQVPSSFI